VRHGRSAPPFPPAAVILTMRLLSHHHDHRRTPVMGLAEVASFAVGTGASTTVLERSLVREALGCPRPAAVPQVSGAA
jgi:hypothetical protein